MIQKHSFPSSQPPNPKLIGIGGTNGSGKDTLAEYLRDRHHYLFVSTSDTLREYALAKYGDILRPTLIKSGNEMRKEFGPGVLVLKAIEEFSSAHNKYQGLVISSIRTKGEVDDLKKAGGVLIFIDADEKIRYERLKSRQRVDDFISYKVFQEHQKIEWHQSDDPGEFSISTVKNMADYSFVNNSDINSFIQYAEKTLLTA
jgi:dephospho-CoA kinase